MTLKTAIGKLVPCAIGVLAGLGWWYVNRREIQLDSYSPQVLAKRWYAMFIYLGILFAIPALTLLIAFWKRLNRETIVLSSLNVGTAWCFVTLYFIASDSLAQAGFTQLGLGRLQWLFLLGGIVWSAVSFYLFGRAVDASIKRQQ